MPFPVSRKRVDKLGRQLADEGTVHADQLEIFSLVLEYYQQLLDMVTGRILDCGYAPTGRVKTTGTLIEKLRREQGIQLSRIQDVAGARVVVGQLRAEQDRAVTKIFAEFKGLERAPMVVDRRADPRHGYRAVHLIVHPEGVPVEIQVRTNLQDLWAQIFENVADRWGRQIRYGGVPNPPSIPDDNTDRAEVVRRLALLSDSIASYEITSAEFMEYERKLSAISALNKMPRIKKLHDLQEKYGLTPSVRAAVKGAYGSLRDIIIGYYCKFEPDKRRRGRILRRRCPRNESPEISDCEALAKWFFPIITKLVAERRSNTARQGDELRGILDSLAQVMNDEVASASLSDRI